jgi:molybdopterin-binding protein
MLQALVSIITSKSDESLELREDEVVYVVIKASNVMIVTD